VISSIGDNILLIGAPGARSGSVHGGAVYVFKRAVTRWRQVAKLIGPSPVEGGRYGGSVSSIDTALVIGADSAGFGRVMFDLDTVPSLPSVEEEDPTSEDTGAHYGDTLKSLFDSVPHAILSTLFFLVLPGLAVGTALFYRRDLSKFATVPRFSKLKNEPVTEEDEEGGAQEHQQRKRALTHTESLLNEQDQELMRGFIRV
jgi:hypothetical protein